MFLDCASPVPATPPLCSRVGEPERRQEFWPEAPVLHRPQEGRCHCEGGVHLLPRDGAQRGPGGIRVWALLPEAASAPRTEPGDLLGAEGGSEGCRDGQAGTKQPAPRPPLQGPSRPPAQGQQPASSVPPLPCSPQSRGSHPLGSHRPAGAGSQPCATPDCASISARRAVQGGRASFLFSL